VNLKKTFYIIDSIGFAVFFAVTSLVMHSVLVGVFCTLLVALGYVLGLQTGEADNG
jgi:Flp pilus assembly protein TadB